MIKDYKTKVTNHVIDYGIKFLSVMSVPLSIISFLAIQCDECWFVSVLPFVFSVLIIGLFFLRKKVSLYFRVQFLISLLFCVGLFTLYLGLLDMASLWFVLASLFAFFYKHTNYAFKVLITSLVFTVATGLLMMFGGSGIPLDFGFDNCQYACVSIRIINFFIIGFLIFKIVKIFFDTMNLYMEEVVHKNKILQDLQDLQEKETIQQLENMKLRNDFKNKEREVVYKNRELKDAFSRIIRFDHALDGISNCLNKKDYDGAISSVRLSKSGINEYESFLRVFHELYPDFTGRLQEKYPVLTDTDIKLCVLITAGLKSVEIAEMLHITDATVAKYRNRLRKKLNIASNSDISEYLISSITTLS